MEPPNHSLTSLFAQLGLDSSEQAINAFITQYAPIDGHIELAKAGFWNASQSAFLAEAIELDSDWAEVVDQLDTMLR